MCTFQLETQPMFPKFLFVKSIHMKHSEGILMNTRLSAVKALASSCFIFNQSRYVLLSENFERRQSGPGSAI